MPRLRRGGRCITPRCSQEEQRRASKRQWHRVQRQIENELFPPRRKNGPTLGLAIENDSALFLEENVDERLQVHSCGTLTTQCPGGLPYRDRMYYFPNPSLCFPFSHSDHSGPCMVILPYNTLTRSKQMHKRTTKQYM